DLGPHLMSPSQPLYRQPTTILGSTPQNVALPNAADTTSGMRLGTHPVGGMAFGNATDPMMLYQHQMQFAFQQQQQLLQQQQQQQQHQQQQHQQQQHQQQLQLQQQQQHRLQQQQPLSSNTGAPSQGNLQLSGEAHGAQTPDATSFAGAGEKTLKDG
ncbi:hypothetical protein BGZ98_005129, partial [Dissophora globulifera]